MKTSKLKRGRLIEVTWRDSNTPTATWYTKREIAEHHNTDLLIKSAGYFYGINKLFLPLYGGSFAGEEYAQRYERITAIPVGCIVKVRKL